jgi:hypothetical protein
MKNRLMSAVVLSFTAVLVLTSCANKVQVYEYKFDSTLDEVFIKKGVSFDKYHTVMIDRVSVWYPTDYRPSGQNIEKARGNLSQAQDMFEETLRRTLSDRYNLTSGKGKNVLRIQVEFIDLRAIPVGGSPPAELNRFSFKTQPGHITMIARLMDSQTDEVLARASDLGKRASSGGEAEVDWDAIASDFEYWAMVFRGWFDQVHGNS